MDQKDVTTSLVAIAKQLLRISQGLNRLYLDQIELAGTLLRKTCSKLNLQSNVLFWRINYFPFIFIRQNVIQAWAV